MSPYTFYITIVPCVQKVDGWKYAQENIKDVKEHLWCRVFINFSSVTCAQPCALTQEVVGELLSKLFFWPESEANTYCNYYIDINKE